MSAPATAAQVSGAGRFRAVLFDVDGTLYHQDRLRVCMAAELAASPFTLGSLDSSARLVRLLRTYRHVHEEMRQLKVADRPLAAFQIAETARREGVREPEVAAAVSEWMQRRPLKYLRWCRRRGLIALLAGLEKRGMQLGVLSDYPAREKLQALGVERFFPHVWCSTDPDIGALKPDPRGFLQACASWSLLPEEVLYVGDRTEVDAAGALAAGVGCAVFGRHAERAVAVREPWRVVIRRCDDVDVLVRAGHLASERS